MRGCHADLPLLRYKIPEHNRIYYPRKNMSQPWIFHRTILRNSVIGMDKEMEMRGVGAGNEEAEAELQIS